MSLTVPLALFGFLVFGPLLFVLMPARRAAIALLLAGTLFLPNAGYIIPVLRSYDKQSATVLAMLLGMLIFDGGRLARYRFHWVDIPMLVWCLCPFASSIANDLGVYDGLAEVMTHIRIYGLPYLLGRLYIHDRDGIKDLVVGLTIAGLIYVPFCVWEMRGGPFFHSRLYGFYPHNYWEQRKPGGWRPSVFFNHGLWLTAFMAYAAVCSVCLWLDNSVVRVGFLKTRWAALAIIGTLMKCNSNSAVAIFMLGTAVALSGRFRRLACAGLILAPIAYTSLRITGLWSGESAVEFYGGKKENAGGSLNTRLQLENRIAGRALERPIFGWGGYGRAFQIQTEDRRGTWTEAIWTKAIGETGLVGLWAWMLSGLLPAWLALRFIDSRRWFTVEDGTVLALILLPPLQTLQGLMVLDFSPISPFCSGALASLAVVKAISPKAQYKTKPDINSEFTEPLTTQQAVPASSSASAETASVP